MTDRSDVSPFTRREAAAALALIMPRDVARIAAWKMFRALRKGEGGFTFAGDTVLLLAVASDDAAARLVAMRPDLREEVERVRADPAAFVRSLKAG